MDNARKSIRGLEGATRLQGARGLESPRHLEGAAGLELKRKFEPTKTRPQQVNTNNPPFEFVIETKQRLREMPVGGDLNLEVHEYELVATVSNETFYTTQQDVTTGTWGGGPPEVRSDDGEHTHAITGNTGAGTSHTHTISGSIANESAHTHPINTNTEYAGSPDYHYHPISSTTDAGSAHTHTHTLSNAAEEAHTHAISFTSDYGVSGPGKHPHNVRIPPLEITIPITTYNWEARGEPYVMAWRNGIYKGEWPLEDEEIPASTPSTIDKIINTIYIAP